MLDGVCGLQHAEGRSAVCDYLMEGDFESVIEVTEVIASLADGGAEIVFGSREQAFG